MTCEVCGEEGAHVCIPEVCAALQKDPQFKAMIQAEIQSHSYALCNDPFNMPDFKPFGDGKRGVLFNAGNSRIIPDDNCWVIQNLIDGEWKSSPWIFGDAKRLLDRLPATPAVAYRLGMAVFGG